MTEEYQINNTQKMVDIEISKKKTLKEALKESHKSQIKKSKIQMSNMDENFKKNREELNDNINNNAPDTATKFKENIIFRKPEIKKIKVIPDNNKINKDTLNSDNSLRKIYVDLNEINIINQEINNIILNQKNTYNNNSIRTCQYTILTFLPL